MSKSMIESKSMMLRKVLSSVTICVFFFVSSILFAQKVKVSEFVKNSNDSKAFYDALSSENDTIIIDRLDRPWSLNPMRFFNLHEKTIIFERDAEIEASKNNFQGTNDALLSFRNCNDISLLGSGNKLCMNKKEYTDGEWRHGLSLWNCTNFVIKNLEIHDSGGDGIFIDGIEKGEYSENIVIDKVLCSNNKRQGISIVSVKNLKVTNSVFENTKGTLPGAGVDFEPDNNQDRIENVAFENCEFRNNDHAGIVLALKNLDNTSQPISIKFTHCSLYDNHNKDNNYIASEIVFSSHKTKPVQGNVLFQACTVKYSEWGLFYGRKTSDAYTVTFTDCVAENICNDGSYPAMYLETPDYFEGRYSLGGYVFNNLKLRYTADVPYFVVRGATLPTLKNVSSIKGTILIDNPFKPEADYINYHSSNNLDVNLEIDYEN